MVDDLLTQAREALERVEHERAQAREQYRAEMADFDDELRRLRGVIRALDPETQTRRKRPAAVQAGPKALAAVRKVLGRGPRSQAEIVRLTGMNDGTVSYALRALVEAGEIAATGARIKGSREFQVKSARAA